MGRFNSPRRGHRPVGDTHGTDDEPTGGGADEVKGIARDQCQRPCGRRVEHRDVFRADHPGSLDAIDVLPLYRVDLKHVTGRGILQSPEEAVAVTRDAQVPVRSWRRRTRDMADATVE